jgi:hypothetical protein
MPDYTLTATLEWFDLDELPELTEYVEDFIRCFGYDGLHTGSVGLDGFTGPTEEGDLVFTTEWIDLDDVPGLVDAIKDRFCFSGDASGSVCLDEVVFA